MGPLMSNRRRSTMADIWCIGGNVNDFPRLQRLAAWSGIVLTVATSSTLLRSFWRRKTTPGRCSRTHTAPADRIERRQLVPLEHGFRSGGLPILCPHCGPWVQLVPSTAPQPRASVHDRRRFIFPDWLSWCRAVRRHHSEFGSGVPSGNAEPTGSNAGDNQGFLRHGSARLMESAGNLLVGYLVSRDRFAAPP